MGDAGGEEDTGAVVEELEVAADEDASPPLPSSAQGEGVAQGSIGVEASERFVSEDETR
jgi:hypothetical protein